MTAESCTKRLQAFWDTLTITVFLGLLWVPTADYFFKLDHAEQPAENRALAKWPVFKGLDQSREFIVEVEKYFNDHFGFRKRLVRLNKHWRGELFHDTTSPDVLVGRDQWLFYSGMSMPENCTRQAAWTEQELRDWCVLLEMRRDWLRVRGIKYLFVVPPDKHTVYPELLPAWMQISDKPTKIQQLVRHMETHSNVPILDLRQALYDAKKRRVAYLKTDTHWNLFGAFMGCRALTEALARQMPGLEPLPMDAYDWEPAPKPPGDLVNLMGATGFYVETEFVAAVSLRPLPEVEILYDSGRFASHGPSGARNCVTRNSKARGKALVFHDSFARRWHSFLGQHFNEVIYVWQYEWDRPVIERERPDVVIDEMLERFFNQQDPLALARKDQLSETQSAVSGL